VGNYDLKLYIILPNEESRTKVIRVEIRDPNATSDDTNDTTIVIDILFHGFIVNLGPPYFQVDNLGKLTGKEGQVSTFLLPRLVDPDGD